ncbi:MAG: leucine-rich repeat protein [Eubacterium sp.]|nr:leucine-rich repeat protein [Eubacterium sp.]
MKNKRKRIISLFLSLILLLSSVTISGLSVFAEDLTSGSCGDNVTYSFNSSTGTLTISGEGPMTDYGFSSSPFYNNSSIINVTIQSGVTSIGKSTFCYCKGLTSVTIPGSVTSIGSSAFFNCSNLTSVTIPGSVTSIGSSAFDCCTGLTSVTIPSSVTSIGSSAFDCCTGLTRVTIPSSVSTIYMSTFSGCTGLTEVVLNEGLKEIKQLAFSGCTGLTSIMLPASLKTIEYDPFIRCNNLTSINVATDSTYFSSQNGILFNKNKTTIKRYPSGKSGTSYSIPSSVTEISDYAFYGCSELESISIPENVSYIGSSSFNNCSGLTSITVSSSNAYFSSQDGVLFNKNSTKLILYPIGKSETSYSIPSSVTSINYSAFNNCSVLTSITIPNGVKSIGASAFENCTGLASITIPDGATSIGSNAFYNTAYYKDNNNWTDNVLYIGNHLINANTSLNGDFVIKESCVSIAANALFGRSGLTSITIPNGVKSIGESAFYNCTGLIKITIPATTQRLGSSAFSGCNNLNEITIKSGGIDIYDSSSTIPSGATIIAEEGSKAQRYAQKYNRNFVELPCFRANFLTIPDDASEPCTASSQCIYCSKKYSDITSTIPVEAGTNIYFKADKESKVLCNVDGIFCVACDVGLSLYNSAGGVASPQRSVVISDPSLIYNVIKLNEDGTYKETDTTERYFLSNTIYEDESDDKFFLIQYIDENNVSYIGYVLKDDVYIEPHSYEETQTVTGKPIKACTACGSSVPHYCGPNGHETELVPVQAATCTEDGIREHYRCVWCNKLFSDAAATDEKELDDFTYSATGHDFSGGKITSEPTCTEQGYTTYTCTACGESYIDDYTEPLGHNYIPNVTPPTCTEQGYTTYTCSRCHDTYISDYTETVPHTPGEAVRENEIPATTTATGSWDEVVYCSVCNTELSRITHTVDKASTGVYIDYDNVIYSGDTIQLPVVIENNVGLLGFGLKFDYPTAIFDSVSVVKHPDFNTGIEDNIGGNAKPGSFKVYWAGNAKSTYNGTLFYIQMSVNDTAVGEGTIGVSYLAGDTFDSDFNDYALKCTDFDFTVNNNTISDYLKIESYAESVTAGDEVELKLKLTQFGNLNEAELNVEYNENLEYKSCSSTSVGCSARDNGGNITLSITGVSATDLNEDIVTLKFRSKDNADAGRYDFILTSEEEGVKLTSCSFDIAASSTSEIAQISIPQGEPVEAGETFTVPVNIENNKGVMGYRLTVKYNENELNPVSVSLNSEFGGNLIDSIGNKSGEFDVVWNNGFEVKEDAALFSITFTAVATRTLTSNVILEYNQGDTFNESFEDVVFNCNNAAVTICSGHVYSEAEVEAGCESYGCKRYTCLNCGKVYETDLTDPIGHYYEYQDNYTTLPAHYECKDCGGEYSADTDELNSLWNSMYINERPSRTAVNYSSLLDLNNDGIINAKDYAALKMLNRLAD